MTRRTASLDTRARLGSPAAVRAVRPVASLLALASIASLVSACASSGSSVATGKAAPATVERTIVQSVDPGSNRSGSDMSLVRDMRPDVHDVAASPDVVWSALPLALSDLGLSGGPMVGQTRTFVTKGPRLRRVLNKVPLSRYLDCGTTSAGSPGAETYLIQLQITSTVVPNGSGAQLRSQVRAQGTATEGTSTGLIDCTSTGELEKRLAQAVDDHLKQP